MSQYRRDPSHFFITYVFPMHFFWSNSHFFPMNVRLFLSDSFSFSFPFSNLTILFEHEFTFESGCNRPFSYVHALIHKVYVCLLFLWFNDIYSVEWFTQHPIPDHTYYWYIRVEILKLSHMYYGDICFHTSGKKWSLTNFYRFIVSFIPSSCVALCNLLSTHSWHYIFLPFRIIFEAINSMKYTFCSHSYMEFIVGIQFLLHIRLLRQIFFLLSYVCHCPKPFTIFHFYRKTFSSAVWIFHIENSYWTLTQELFSSFDDGIVYMGKN